MHQGLTLCAIVSRFTDEESELREVKGLSQGQEAKLRGDRAVTQVAKWI